MIPNEDTRLSPEVREVKQGEVVKTWEQIKQEFAEQAKEFAQALAQTGKALRNLFDPSHDAIDADPPRQPDPGASETPLLEGHDEHS